MFGGDSGRAALRRVGSSPRAAAPPTRHTLSRSQSIKKKSGAAKRSKRARVRAGLAAALQELRLAGRKHGLRLGFGAGGASSEAAVVSAGAARPRASDDDVVQGGGCSAACAAAPLHVSAGAAEAQASRGEGADGGRRVNAARGCPPLLLVMALLALALACVVALGRAPACCCCTCAAWLCRGPLLCGSAASTGGRHRSSAVQRQMPTLDDV